MARLRWDIGVTLLLTALIGVGTYTVTGNVLKNYDFKEPETNIVADGSIGAQADESIPRVSSIADIKAHNGVFTTEYRLSSL